MPTKPRRGEGATSAARRRRWPWVVGAAVLLGALWPLVTDPYREEEKELRTRLREAVKEGFPDEAEEFSRTVGLSPFSPSSPLEASSPSPHGAVVLVHGLDDPGKVWRSLAPELHEQGFDVWLMHYPNDQPIAESAGLLFEELRGLRQGGVERIALVGHSMGGLVSRELLTSPEIGYGPSVHDGIVPEVTALIMVGTPNHGSPLARFRGVMEARDQWARLTRGEASWLSGILDGAGEAKIDLLPDSRFLTELNGRPPPEGVDTLTIAGVVSPWSPREIQDWIESRKRDATDDRRRRLEELGESLLGLANGLGDGLVSVESTRLEGVEHQTVEGTHLTMIRNLTAESDRTPPAVPIIVDRLMRAGS
jgi:pimeloyl-ACP methyl ester carboxylesterase